MGSPFNSKKLLSSLALAATLFGFQVVIAQQAAAPPAGETETWFGKIDTGVMKLRVKIDVSSNDGDLSATMVSLDQGKDEIPIDSIAFDDGKMTFEIKKLSGEFEGEVSKDGMSAAGTWTQFGRPMSLKLDKVDEIPVEPEPTEVWQGELNAGIAKLKLQFRLFEKEGEETSVLFDSLSQQTKGLPASINIDGDDVEFKVPAAMATFSGKYNDDKTTIEGTWKQGPQAFPLTMSKSETVADSAPPPKRPQHPVAPYPYREESVRIKNPKADCELAGTLTLPKSDGDKKFPAVILITGSGPQDRDESLLGHKPFLVIADHLTRKGIAVLRYDDRGTAESTGDFAKATTKDFASDVFHIVKFLHKHKEIDSGRIGLVGHSEGGLVAPLVASKMHGKIAHIVMLAGPGVDGGEILKAQTTAMAKAQGMTDEDLADDQAMLEKMIAAIRGGMSKDDFEKTVDELIEKQKAKQAEQDDEKEKTSDEEFALAKMGSAQFASPWFRYFISYDPVPALKNVGCPVLSMIGEKDLQVLVDQNKGPIEEALKAGGNSDYRSIVLEGLNHLFQPCGTGSPMEYQSIEETFSPKALDEITDWVLKH